MENSASIGNKGLIQQGYTSCSLSDLNSMSNGLRFTPLFCMGLAIAGLFIQNPYIHWGLAALGILPFWFPNHHPFDLLYNHVIRKIVGAVKLPPNPLQRRIACVMGGMMNIGIGFGFYLNNPIIAYVFAGILIPLQIIVITTHFCVASWMYEGFLKVFGIWNGPIMISDAKKMVKNGATLLDVRSVDEFNDKHLPNAVNIPLDVIENAFDKLKNSELVIYCKSGVRSSDARKRLKALGHKNVYSMGAMNRWGES